MTLGIAWFRYEFTLDLAIDSLPLVAQALIAVDDDFDFYVNGKFLLGNHDHGGADDIFFVDFLSDLQNGENVLAIRGIDGWSDTTGIDRDYERVLFDGHISTVPEPATLALLGIGFVGLGVIFRRYKNL
ncbi:MAG: PEP-CTERM sorting domain-containing protein [Desulfobacteraceae bacterium]|nr:PEP-CTERM sorting domain-containing protein [Desulfobacteraceae bacterium]